MGIVLRDTTPTAKPVIEKDDTKLDWQNIELDTLGKEFGALLVAHLHSLEAANKTKDAFEKPFRDACEVTNGYQMVFSYKKIRLGEWEVRVAEAPMREGKAKVNAQSLFKKKASK